MRSVRFDPDSSPHLGRVIRIWIAIVTLSTIFQSFDLFDGAAAADDGYRIVRVTSLADSGTGSLRACIELSSPRVCVFETSGRISLAQPLAIKHGNLIIAGQTAPSPGITITNAGIIVRASNVTIEHIAVRIGDFKVGPKFAERDGLRAESAAARGVTFRNVSVSWAVDENVSTRGRVRDITLENCIVSEALYRSRHPEGPHSMGMLVGNGARNVSILGTLLAANYDRNVRWKQDTTGRMINNVIYGWGGSASGNATNLSDHGGRGRAIQLDIVGNVYLPGPRSGPGTYSVYAYAPPPGTTVYLADNLAPKLTNLDPSTLAPSPVFAGGVRFPVRVTMESVTTTAGSRPWERDATDSAVIAGVTNRTLTIRNRARRFPVIASNRRPLSLESKNLTAAQLREKLRSFEFGVGDATGHPGYPAPN